MNDWGYLGNVFWGGVRGGFKMKGWVGIGEKVLGKIWYI